MNGVVAIGAVEPGLLTVGEIISMVRARKGWSARELSRRAGLSPSYVTKVEAGEIEPSFKAFSALAVALNMTSSEIVFSIWQEAGRHGHEEV